MLSLTKHRNWPVLLGFEGLLNMVRVNNYIQHSTWVKVHYVIVYITQNILFLYAIHLMLEGYFEVFC